VIEVIHLSCAQEKTAIIFEHAAGVTADFSGAQKSTVWADVGGGVNFQNILK